MYLFCSFDIASSNFFRLLCSLLVFFAQSNSWEKQVQWLNEIEVTDQIDSAWERTNAFSQGFFFHATSEKALESILKAKKVEVRHEKVYRGAFVSTQPELSFGRCVLAFKRTIERLSSLEHGFTREQGTYWAGFSRDIPVSESTLAYIILNSKSEDERQQLETQCEEWTGRKINVILIDDVQQKLKHVERLKMGIPSEWPEEGEQVGQKILKAMTLAIPQQARTGQQSRPYGQQMWTMANQFGQKILAIPQRAFRQRQREAVVSSGSHQQYHRRQMLATAY